MRQKVDVLLVNPTDSSAVTSAIESTNSANIPVITVDRSVDGGKVVTHIASDNVAGGKMAAQFIVDHLKNGGNIVELEGIPGSSAARERGEGFHQVIDKCKLSLYFGTKEPFFCTFLQKALSPFLKECAKFFVNYFGRENPSIQRRGRRT